MIQFFLILSALLTDYVSISNTNNTTAIDLPTLPEIPERKAKQKIYLTASNIRNEGYQAQIHKVTTVDGYILEMHRIPYRRHEIAGDSSRIIVFLMHGLTAASNAFIFLGPENAIGYNLADAGYDVWMGNARGTKNSRFHVTLNPDHKQQAMKFFDFTWEEIGLYDISAMIDYILAHTGQKKLHYIGHSQGGTVFLVLTSMRPEYNKKIASAHLLAGVGYQNHFPDETIKSFATFTDSIFGSAKKYLKVMEIFPLNAVDVITPASSFYSSLSQYFDLSSICKPEYFKYLDLCNLLSIEKSSRDVSLRTGDKSINGTGDDVELKGGGSLKQVAHYGQNIRDSAFRRWNYGKELTNQEIYGTSDPPLYNLKEITTKVTMHYTVGDILVDEKDVLSMVGDMPNAVARKVARDNFLHEDFIAAADMKKLVTDYIILDIKNMKPKPLPKLSSSSSNTSTILLPGDAFDKLMPSSAASSVLDVTIKLYFLFVSLRVF